MYFPEFFEIAHATPPRLDLSQSRREAAADRWLGPLADPKVLADPKQQCSRPGMRHQHFDLTISNT
jgi:hypothetical protein